MSNWKSNTNKFLLLAPGVLLNEKLDNAISHLDKFFEEANHKAFVTAGIRTADEQLELIKKYCVRFKILDDQIQNAELDKKITWNGKEIYSWQMGWCKLLNSGVIINPPIRAEVLLDYTNDNGINRKGGFISESPHFFGRSFDIGGASNSIEDEKQIIITAIKSGEFPTMRYKAERKNNCIHIDV